MPFNVFSQIAGEGREHLGTFKTTREATAFIQEQKKKMEQYRDAGATIPHIEYTVEHIRVDKDGLIVGKKVGGLNLDAATKEAERLYAHREYKIALANEIIDEMRVGLSAKQQKILDFMLEQIQPSDTVEKRYSIGIKDYCREFNIDYRRNSTNYQDIKAGVKSINNQSKWISVDKHETVLVQWFRNVKINHERDTIEYNIDDTIAPYLFGLINTGNYTQYTKHQTGAFESKYSRPLFLILKRYLDVGITEPVLPIEKLRTLLAAEKYTRYPDFKRFVIDMAVNEINNYTNIKVSWEAFAAAGSRAKTHIAFTVKELSWMNDDERNEVEGRQWSRAKAFGELDLLPPI